MSEDTSKSLRTKGDSSEVFKEWCTIVLSLPMQKRSRESAVSFGQWPKTKTDQKLKKQRTRQKPRTLTTKTISFKKDTQVTM